MRPSVGLTYVEATHHGRHRSLTLRLLVDSGATYSMVPADVAESLGARNIRVEEFEIADRSTVHWRVGEGEVELLGRRSTTLVIFGEGSTEGLLGVYALEGLALELDARLRVVRPSRRLPLYAVSRGQGLGTG